MTTEPATNGGAIVDIDGLPVFYETHGSGAPLVLLHGGMATNVTWGAQIADFAAHRLVIAPERQAHGHTPDRDGPLSYQAMADQTVAVLEALEVARCDLLGWSDGGMVGVLVAAQRPDLVRSLSVTGTSFSSAGYVPGANEALVELPADDPEMTVFAAMYAEASPDGPEHFPAVWDKVRAMWAEPFDWSWALERITAPVLVIVGDDDIVTVAHADEFARRLPDGRLAVIPGTSHAAPMEKPALFNAMVLDFLARPKVTTWMPIRRRPAPAP